VNGLAVAPLKDAPAEGNVWTNASEISGHCAPMSGGVSSVLHRICVRRYTYDDGARGGAATLREMHVELDEESVYFFLQTPGVCSLIGPFFGSVLKTHTRPGAHFF